MPKDPGRSTAPTKGSVGAASGMGQVVPFTRRDRPVTVGVEGGTVVPFSPYRLQSLNDRWDSAVAHVGVSEATDDQLRDVFLLMVAEMIGMTVPGKGWGGN